MSTFRQLRFDQVFQSCNLYPYLTADVCYKNYSQTERSRCNAILDKAGKTVNGKYDFVGWTRLSIEECIVARVHHRPCSVVPLNLSFGKELRHYLKRHTTSAKESGTQSDEIAADGCMLQHDVTMFRIVHNSPVSLYMDDTLCENFSFQNEITVFKRGRQAKANWTKQLHSGIHTVFFKNDIATGRYEREQQIGETRYQ